MNGQIFKFFLAQVLKSFKEPLDAVGIVGHNQNVAQRLKSSSEVVMIVASFFTSDIFVTSCWDPFSTFLKRVMMNFLKA
jgi:hypothetical protein